MGLGYMAVILFLIMDPLGNIPSFLKMLNAVPKNKRSLVLVREMGFALCAMLICFFLGEYVFSLLKISETAIRLTSGLILFLVAIKILFPAIDSIRANLPTGEPFITPLAIPLVAGPSLLATIMLFAMLEKSQTALLAALLIAWFSALLILYFSERIQRTIKVNGLMAAERLMALVLVMLGIQRFLEGLHQFIKACQ